MRTENSILRAGTLALAMMLAPPAWADDAPADPPARVGRIALVEGTVSFHPSPNDQWGAAAVNYPVAQATALWTDDGARAELELGEARLRLDADTELDIVQLDDHSVVLSVPQGRADITLGQPIGDERYQIQTPRGEVDLGGNGTYRIFAGTPQQPTRIASITGQLILTDQNNLAVPAGREAVSTTGDPPTFQLAAASQDSFDQWSTERDHKIAEHVRPAFVPAMPGVSALDEYGSWHGDTTYGHVWQPSAVQAGWQPYRYGHWATIAPWGYTWMDDAPWGFAPFHYGRWVQIAGVWSWVPIEPAAAVTPEPVAIAPAVVVAPPVFPVYAPALVAFAGDPGALVVGGIGIGVGVGWFPLGPGELWQPWYAHSDGYLVSANFTNVNRTVITNIHNTAIINNNGRGLVNQHAATVVPAGTFAGGRSVGNTALRLDPARLQDPVSVAHSAGGHGAMPLPRPEPGAHVGGGEHQAKAPPAPSLPRRQPAMAPRPAQRAFGPAAHPFGPPGGHANGQPRVAAPHPFQAGPGFRPPIGTTSRTPEGGRGGFGRPPGPGGGPPHPGSGQPPHGMPGQPPHAPSQAGHAPPQASHAAPPHPSGDRRQNGP